MRHHFNDLHIHLQTLLGKPSVNDISLFFKVVQVEHKPTKVWDRMLSNFLNGRITRYLFYKLKLHTPGNEYIRAEYPG